MTRPFLARITPLGTGKRDLNFVDDFGAVADGILDPDTGLMTGTDNYAAVSDYIDYGIACGDAQVRLLVPPGNYHLSGNISFVTRANEDVGIKNSIVNAYGAATDQAWIGPIGTIVNDFAHSARIESVSAGATSVKVIAAGCHPATDVSIFSEGDCVCIGGLGMQPDSFPPNLGYFEFPKITRIDGQGIHLSRALENDYLATWPDIDTKNVTVTSGSPAVFRLDNHGMSTNQFIYVDRRVGGSVPAGITRNQEYRLAAPTKDTFQLTLGGVPVGTTSAGSRVTIHTAGDLGGPASIILMRPTFDCRHVMKGLRCTNIHSLTSVGGRNATCIDMVCDGLGFSPSIGEHITIESCQTGGQNEVDKLVSNLTYRDCYSDLSPRNLLFFSTSIDHCLIENCRYTSLAGTPKNTTIAGSHIDLIAVGGNGYGHAETLTATDSHFEASTPCARTIDLSAMTFSGGTFSAPKVAAYPLYQAIVPGLKMAWGIYAGGFVYHQDSTNAINAFTVTALRESDDVIYADTDWVGPIPGNVYHGGPPTLIGNIPLESVTVTGCTGSDLTGYADCA
jgi:hypothetical protein